ncbi:MAG: hypothetical protein AAF511_10970, partial [Pseudomonadota bacterium]
MAKQLKTLENAVAFLSLGLLLTATPASAAPIKYHIQGLGDIAGGETASRAFGVNDAGQVVGYSFSASGQEAFVWDAENGMQGLGDLAGGSFMSDARAINNAGTVVGRSQSAGGLQGFTWDSVNGLSGLSELSGGGFNSMAFAINDSGVIAGRSDGPGNITQAVRWDMSGQIEGLGFLKDQTFSEAWGINEDGEIVGQGTVNNGFASFIWSEEDGMRSLADLPGGEFLSDAFDINNNRIVA